MRTGLFGRETYVARAEACWSCCTRNTDVMLIKASSKIHLTREKTAAKPSLLLSTGFQARTIL